MISKKSVQYVINVNKRILARALKHRESKKDTAMDMYLTGKIDAYESIIESLEILIKE